MAIVQTITTVLKFVPLLLVGTLGWFFVAKANFGPFNDVYGRYFTDDQPARIFVCVPTWPGPFDIEIDCIAVT